MVCTQTSPIYRCWILRTYYAIWCVVKQNTNYLTKFTPSFLRAMITVTDVHQCINCDIFICLFDNWLYIKRNCLARRRGSTKRENRLLWKLKWKKHRLLLFCLHLDSGFGRWLYLMLNNLVWFCLVKYWYSRKSNLSFLLCFLLNIVSRSLDVITSKFN